MSKTGLRKGLSELSKEEIIGVVCELYDSRKDAREYLDYWLDPDPEKALEDYKERVDKMFFYSTGKNRSQPAVNDLKRLVNHFSTIVFDSEKIDDLLVHIAERQYIWLTRKRSGFNQCETAVRRACDNARTYIESADLEDLYGLRLERLDESIKDFYNDLPRPRRRWWRHL